MLPPNQPMMRSAEARPITHRRLWRSLLLLLVLTAGAFFVGWAQKLPCRLHGYGPGNSYAYTRLCYSDVHVAWTSQGLSEGRLPYVDQPVEYPVLLGGLMALAVVGADSAGEFFDHTAALLLVGALVVTATTALLLGPARMADAALVAVAPGMILHGTVNWDVAAAAFAGLGLLAWARQRPAAAGVALGLGAAVKLYPIVFLGPLLVLCLRQKQLRAWAQALTAAVATCVLCNGVAAAIAGAFPFGPDDAPRNAVLRFFALNRDRPADWDSVWFVVQELMGVLRDDPAWAFSVPTVNLWTAAMLSAGMGALAVLLWRSPLPARVGQAVFLTTAIFVLTNKVFSPQYTIWLIPLAVLARPRWAPFLGWQVLEVLLVITRFAYFEHIGTGGGLPLRFFMAAVVARDLALLALMYDVVQDIRRPAQDDLRMANGDDPAGGVLAGATSTG